MLTVYISWSKLVAPLMLCNIRVGGGQGISAASALVDVGVSRVAWLSKKTALQIDGNVWRVSSLGKAMLAGMLASLIPILALFFFNDNRSLGLESEAHTVAPTVSEGNYLFHLDAKLVNLVYSVLSKI